MTEQKASEILESISDSIVALDHEWRYSFVNAAAERLSGYRREELMGRTCWEMFPATVGTPSETAFRRAMNEGATVHIEERHAPFDRWFQEIAYPSAGGIIVQTREITEKKRTELALQRIELHSRTLLDSIEARRAEQERTVSEERWRSVFENSGIGMALNDSQGRFAVTNRAYQEMLGYTADELRALSWADVTRPEDYQANQDLGMKLWTGALQQFKIEKKNYRKDGRSIWVRNTVSLIPGTEHVPRFCLAIVEDITERKRAEEALRESEERLRLFIENVRDYALIQCDPEGVVTTWNSGAERLFGFVEDEIVGRPAATLQTVENQRNGVAALHMEAALQNDRSEHEEWLVRSDGRRFWAHWVTSRIRDHQGKFRGYAKVLRDETERKHAQEALLESERLLRRSLAEKEALLKEVHHRVKNNLQVIISLLNLQSRHIKDREVLALFEEARNRVQSIAGIHQMLYRSDSLAEVDVAAHARQLTDDLVQFYGLRGRVGVEIVTEGEVKLSIERAVPASLILNELLSNAFKHAFPSHLSGTVNVEIRAESDAYLIGVRDTGVGMPPDFGERSTRSLGMKLVKALVNQLEAQLEISSQDGTVISVRFPKIVGS